MSQRTGSISVNTADIFPIIKKWLYSEHDIFLRELVSNASDAITKRTTLGRSQNQEIPEAKITIELEKTKKIIRISDNGIGMTEAEVEKYIAQLAFSGAQEFVDKMKKSGADTKDDIIGKFGLGFYSAFMVADKVEVETLSHEPGAIAAKWTCAGDTEYSFSDSSKTEVGTQITLHLNDESKEFLDFYKTKEVLDRYCKFMVHPITLIDLERKSELEKELEKELKKEKKEGEEQTSLPNPEHAVAKINEIGPLWKKDPSTITDEDYKNFYRTLFPYDQEPLFWLHLNVDHPFELQGILYFPKLNPNKPITEQSIGLYCKQVFVSDNIKHIIPEFLGMLKGAIDSTDIPLNVSRSALQGDPNVKKISNYVIKKVAESLKKLFNSDRKRFEQVWPDIGLFVKYGCISDDKFDELTRKFVLFKNSEDKLLTLEEYQNEIPADYKEKLKDKVIYFNKDQSDPSLRKQLLEKGIHSIETDNYIDPHFMQHSESKVQDEKKITFTAVDAEIEHLLANQEVGPEDLKIKDLFNEFLNPTKEGEDQKDTFKAFEVEVKNYQDSKALAYLKVDESSKRMKLMAQQMGQAGFQFPLKKTLVINPSNPLIKNALKIWEKGNKELVDKLCHHVQDLATISSEGLGPEDKDKFVTRSQNLIEELSQYAIS